MVVGDEAYGQSVPGKEYKRKKQARERRIGMRLWIHFWNLLENSFRRTHSPTLMRSNICTTTLPHACACGSHGWGGYLVVICPLLKIVLKIFFLLFYVILKRPIFGKSRFY